MLVKLLSRRIRKIQNIKMADTEKEEAAHLEQEFKWILKEQVHLVFKQLHTILSECVKRFPVPLYNCEGQQKQDKYTLTSPNDTMKCTVHVNGDTITFGEICFKVQRNHQMVTYRTAITYDNPWKLQQVQDAGNHLQMALLLLTNLGENYVFTSSEEVLHILGNVLGTLQRGRTCLIVPRKRSMDELMKSKNMKQLVPNLPEDLAISFYIQSHKLVFAVYQLQVGEGGGMTFTTQQAEASMPWTNEVLVLFTVALQLAQQLKDKISVFSTYKDFQVGPKLVRPDIQLETS